MKKIILILSYVPLAYLIYIYAGHGIVEAFIERDEFLEVIDVLGLGATISFLLLIATGILDTFVAILLLAKDKIMPNLPYVYLFLWVGLWPFIPRAIEWYGGMNAEPLEAAKISVIALIAYAINRLYHDSK